MAQRHRVRSSLSRTLLTSAVLAAFASPAAHGDASGAPQTLDKVVVTAAGFEQKVIDAPASISVVSREELSRRPYTSLVDSCATSKASMSAWRPPTRTAAPPCRCAGCRPSTPWC